MLYYLHGYQSKPESKKGTLFRNRLGAIPIEYHEGPPERLDIDQALQQIERVIGDDPGPILIGSSLGGFLAAEAALRVKAIKAIVLLNPAIIPPSAELTKLSGIPNAILKRMQSSPLFETKINVAIVILVGTHDELVPLDWVLSFARGQEATVKFLDDDHAFTEKLSILPGLIDGILSSISRRPTC